MHYEEQVPRLPERLEQALSSAFNDLPNDGLRSLLLCMSMFSSGYKFEIDRLILKWIDEGLTQIKSEAEMFSQLEDRNVMTCVAANCKHNNVDQCFKSPAIAASIVRYSLLRQGATICVYVQFSRYIPL